MPPLEGSGTVEGFEGFKGLDTAPLKRTLRPVTAAKFVVKNHPASHDVEKEFQTFPLHLN